MNNLDTALLWLQALARRDLIGLLALSAGDITLHGVPGVAAVRGNERLREWFGTTELSVTPREAHLLGQRILLVDACGACVMQVADGLVTSFLRDEGPGPLLRHGFRRARRVVLEQAA